MSFITVQPQIKASDQLVGAPIATSVNLECIVDAFPKAVHYWQFSDNLLINSSRQNTQETTNGYTTTMSLTIKNLTTADFGTYICGSKNSLGENEIALKLYGKQMEIMIEPYNFYYVLL